MGITTGKFDPTKNIPQLNSKGDEWVQWHKTLKQNFGKKVSNALWLKAWAKRGSSGANTSELRNYMSSQGVTIDSSAWNKVVDAGGSVMDFVGDAFQVGQYVAIGLGVIIVGGLGMVIFNLARRPAQNAGLAARAFIMKGK